MNQFLYYLDALQRDEKFLFFTIGATITASLAIFYFGDEPDRSYQNYKNYKEINKPFEQLYQDIKDLLDADYINHMNMIATLDTTHKKFITLTTLIPYTDLDYYVSRITNRREVILQKICRSEQRIDPSCPYINDYITTLKSTNENLKTFLPLLEAYKYFKRSHETIKEVQETIKKTSFVYEAEELCAQNPAAEKYATIEEFVVNFHITTLNQGTLYPFLSYQNSLYNLINMILEKINDLEKQEKKLSPHIDTHYISSALDELHTVFTSLKKLNGFVTLHPNYAAEIHCEQKDQYQKELLRLARRGY